MRVFKEASGCRQVLRVRYNCPGLVSSVPGLQGSVIIQALKPQQEVVSLQLLQLLIFCVTSYPSSLLGSLLSTSLMSTAACCGCQRALRLDKAAPDRRPGCTKGFGQDAATCETEIKRLLAHTTRKWNYSETQSAIFTSLMTKLILSFTASCDL